jgi:two-component system response regulator TctD
LEARVRALIRRGQGIAEPLLVFGPLSLERTTGAVYLSGNLIDLPRRERSVLEGLMVRSGKVVPRERLAAEVFGYDEPVAPNALEVYIARLRRKLEASDVEIVTVRGLGYLLHRN